MTEAVPNYAGKARVGTRSNCFGVALTAGDGVYRSSRDPITDLLFFGNFLYFQNVYIFKKAKPFLFPSLFWPFKDEQ